MLADKNIINKKIIFHQISLLFKLFNIFSTSLL